MSRILSGLLLLFGLFSSLAEAAVTSVDHQLTVRLDPASRTLNVEDTMTLGGSGEAVFHLARPLRITGLTVNGRKTAVQRDGERVRLPLGEGNRHRVTLRYQGLLDPLPEDPEGLSGSPMLASARGGYLAAGSAWHPLFPGLAAGYRITLILPEAQKAVVPGRLISEQTGDGRHRAVFQSDMPQQGIVLIAGPFVVEERRLGDIRLRTYFPARLSGLAEGYLDSAAGYIERYGRSIGPYPFSSFAIVSGPLPVGLGFPGLTYIGERVVRLPFIRFTSLGHEVLHSWWGTAVETDYRNGNWAEGLTTYMADYAFAAERRKDGGAEMRREWLRDYAALPSGEDTPVRTFVSRRHTASQIIGYNKVAYIFHMLRDKIGASSFDQGIRNFWRRHRFQTAGWEDLRAAFDQASGDDLGRFFRQWIDRKGAPVLTLSHVVAGEDAVSFTLSQPEPPYALDVPVTLKTEDGEKTVRVSMDGRETRVELPVASQPLALTIDPALDLFRRLDPAETPPILRDTMLDERTRLVIPDGDEAVADAAQRLAARLGAGREASADDGPLLVIGTTAMVGPHLARADLPPTPDSLAGRGSARVWAARRENSGDPVMVVEADDRDALEALSRPLPHYGRRSYLVFEGSKAVDKGVWPMPPGSLSFVFP